MGGGGGGGGGSCTQKCSGTASDSSIEQIMVRFRRIAPKPAVGGPAEVVFTKQTRQKRRYVKSKNKKRVVSEEENNIISSSDPSIQVVGEEEEVVTLSLLPETPVSFNTTSTHLDLTPIHEPNPMAQMMQMQQLQLHQNQSTESVVIMECVEGIGSSEMVDLENDTCPGFISDGYDRVWWTNQAYRMMVGSEMVRVVMKDRFPVTWGSAFVCRVRLQYTLREEKKSMIVPCDVWNINGGDFAWRLDVQAALSLGR